MCRKTKQEVVLRIEAIQNVYKVGYVVRHEGGHFVVATMLLKPIEVFMLSSCYILQMTNFDHLFSTYADKDTQRENFNILGIFCLKQIFFSLKYC